MGIFAAKREICAKKRPIAPLRGHFRQKITLQAGNFAPNSRARRVLSLDLALPPHFFRKNNVSTGLFGTSIGVFSPEKGYTPASEGSTPARQGEIKTSGPQITQITRIIRGLQYRNLWTSDSDGKEERMT
jgi:hypothetical protein